MAAQAIISRVPERTCAGCRRKVPRTELVRVIATRKGELLLDKAMTAPGRGAWVHGLDACVDLAVRGGFARSFRRGVQMHAQVIELLKSLESVKSEWVGGVASPAAPGVATSPNIGRVRKRGATQ